MMDAPDDSLWTAASLMLAVLLGLVGGSFAMALAWRLPRGEPWVAGRSRCPNCGTPLAPMTLVPVFSWLALGGRARCCGAPIPAAYPVGEALAALAFMAAVARLDWAPETAALCLLAILLLASAVIDLRHRYLPDGLTLAVALLGLGSSLAGWTVPPAQGLAAALAVGGLLWAVRWALSRRLRRVALGLGDVKLFAAAGWWIGPGGMPWLVLAAACLGLVAYPLWWLARRHQGQEWTEMPFGPAIALAFYALAWGVL
ncbi:prepilin peptidase [Nitrospirillum pindoramense]|uniref:Prepilin leader peptidase/N-methyltransferase n=1 Tax=Nitrospirillum amazonense TaxID=28077 RepID=A0A560HKW8_9PROT|nr:A24 family peptidase [Nitrospirillum amazonense]TWB45984.1 leader peptidase (prepilin peptidase)/N-methyltransferase [Nitrospirillum amazonense]